MNQELETWKSNDIHTDIWLGMVFSSKLKFKNLNFLMHALPLKLFEILQTEYSN